MPPYNKRKTIPCKHFLSGKCTKAGCPFLHEKRAAVSPATDVLIAMLRLLFEKNTSTIYSDGVLNLRQFKLCPDLSGVASSVDFNSVNFCNALAQVIKEKIATPEYINVDSNEIKTVFHLMKALERHNCHITLKGFSAADNSISSFDFIKQIAVCPQLVEVVLRGNPIAAENEYRVKVRKGIPTLLGIDGKSVEVQPLSTPWPVPTAHTEAGMPLLLQVESNLIKVLETSGVDAIVQLYAAQSCFTFTVHDGAEFSTPIGYPKNKKEIPRDFVAIRSAHTDLSHNMTKGARTRAFKTGRMDVLTAMRETLYPARFHVQHLLDGNANVEFLSAGVKEPIAIVTLHGTMCWKHVDQLPSDEPLRRHFDRTLVIRPTEGGFEVTRDAVTLRTMTTSEPLFMPKNASRLEQLGSRFHLTQDVVSVIVDCVASASAPEAELYQSLNAVRRIGNDRWLECVQLCPNNAPDALKVARVVEHYRLAPSYAVQALTTTQGDPAAIQGILSSVPQEAYVQIV